MNLQFLVRATRVAQRYPNDYPLLRLLSDCYAQPAGPADLDMAGSLSFAAATCNYVPGSGDKFPALLDYAYYVHELGRPDAALQMMQLPFPPTSTLQQFRVTVCLNTGRYGAALVEYKNWPEHDAPVLTRAAINAATAAVLSGHADDLDDIRNQHAAEFNDSALSPVFDAYAEILAGRDVNLVPEIPKPLRGKWEGLQWALALGQIDLLRGQEEYRAPFSEVMKSFPNNHLAWVMMNAYERHTPSAEGQQFYSALEWLYGDNPWVRDVVEFKQGGKPRAIDATPLFEQLKTWPAVRWPSAVDPKRRAMPGAGDPSPWMVAAAVNQLRESEPQRAQELAHRYYAYSMGLSPSGPRVFANHLIHTLEQTSVSPMANSGASIQITPGRKKKGREVTSVKEPGER
jgi:hypothetical protein